MLSFLNSDESLAESIQFIEEAIPMGLFSMDCKTKDMRWSAGTFRLMGLDPTRHQATVSTFALMIHPEQRAAVELAIYNAVPLHLDLQIVNSIRRPRWVRVNGELLIDALGRPERMVGSILDVSAEYEARFFSKAVQRRLDAMHSICSPIRWTAGAHGQIERIEGWEALTGQAQENIRDDGWKNVIHPDDVERVGVSRARAIEAGEAYEIEMRIRRNDGGFRWMISRCTPVRDEDGNIAEWIGFLTDIHGGKEWLTKGDHPEQLTGAQVRAARAIANWSVKELSEAANVPISTIRRIEEFDGAVGSCGTPSGRIRRALEAAGVDFVSPPFGKPAVRPT